MNTIECPQLTTYTPRHQFQIPEAATANPVSVEKPRIKELPNDDAGSSWDARQESGIESERETIRRARLGDAMAWEVLVRQNLAWVLRTCCRWAGSRAQAEDLTQEVFVRVFQTLHTYRPEMGGFRNWMSRITRNLLIDDYRRHCLERRNVFSGSTDERTQSALCSVPSSGSSAEFRLERQERIAALRRALRLLGREVREAVILRDVQGLSYQEIAELMETPLGTVKSRIKRGRLELVRLLRQRPTLPPGFVPSAGAAA